LRGLALARERGRVLAWDAADGLFLFTFAGALEGQRPSPVSLAAACGADDGSSYAVGGSYPPAVCLLAPDLTPRWQHPLPQRATAVALDPLGQYLAAADAGCGLHVFERSGRKVWQANTARPLCHLAFVPEKAVLVGSADFGLVACFDATGTCLWRDGLVAHVGSLAVSGDGGCVVLACFSDGLYRYAVDRAQGVRVPLEAPCHLAALSYTGDRILTAGRDNRLCLREGGGAVRDQFGLGGAAVALAVGALGETAVVGLAEGEILALDLRPDGLP
jgi:hypothetical protein